MTICLAGLCTDEKKPVAIMAADRMVTMGGFIEFEHAVPKMTAVSDCAVAAIAGDTLVGTRLAQEVVDRSSGSSRLEELASQLAGHFESTRQLMMESQILAPRGLSLQHFYGTHASLNPQITMMLDQSLAQFNLGVELLLAGVDDTGAHIHSIHNPGRPDQRHDVIGYAAIGSGTIHALQALIGFGHCSTAGFKETLFRVYAAKRRSEVAPGVGVDTDMVVITSAGTHWLNEAELGELRKIYEDFAALTGGGLEKQLDAFQVEGLDFHGSRSDGNSE